MVLFRLFRVIPSVRVSSKDVRTDSAKKGTLKTFLIRNISSSIALQGLDHKTVVQAVQRQEDRDYVGPPHPVSKLRPVLYCTAKQETPLQAAHRTSLLETQSWNQNYWLQHNTAFEKEKQAFITKKLSEKYSIASRHGNEDQLTLTSEEMAEFYKQFLDQNFDQHMQYNREWYKRNFKHIIMAAKVWIESKRR